AGTAHTPARLASPPSREQADTQPPAVEDAARLLRTAAAEDLELGLFLRLAVVLGARRGELCALRWSEVDLDQGEVLIAGAVVRVPPTRPCSPSRPRPTPSAAWPSAPAQSRSCAPAGSPRSRTPSPAGAPWRLMPMCFPPSPTAQRGSIPTASPTGSSGSPA